jgi:hypothetical protein
MNLDIQSLLALLGTVALILVAMEHIVKALENLCSAIARLIIRFRRLMQVIGRRISRK